MNKFARAVTLGCFVWVLSFVLLYGFHDGQTWLNELSTATRLFDIIFSYDDKDDDDNKARLPILFLACPILLAGTICSCLTLATRSYPDEIPSWDESSSSKQTNRRLFTTIQRLPRRVQVIVYLFQKYCCKQGGGDLNFDFLSFAFLLVPLTVYVVSSVHRKLFVMSEGEFSSSTATTSVSLFGSNDAIAKVSNSFGMAALLAMSIFLIPASRHGAILRVVGWNPAAAIRLHVWAGRIVVFGGILHGSTSLFGSSWWRMLLLPPSSCWALRSEYMDKEELNKSSSMLLITTDCQEMDSTSPCFSCSDYFRNLTGFLAAVGLLVIAISSLDAFRRRWYAMFYRIHMFAGPLVFVMVILHYRRAILYLAGGVLYYLASTLPVVVENQSSIRQDGGVRLLSVQCIQEESELETPKPISLRQRPCVSLTFEASSQALDRYRAGQYVKLIAPSISFISHPFTINPVPGYDDRLQVIFRVVGPFTSALADAALSTSGLAGGTPISIGLEGFHGSNFRIRQVLQHDTVVLVAGGIGITPYLSLLHKVKDAAKKKYNVHWKRKIVLHWICRDQGLIEYIKRVYLDPLLTNETGASCGTNPLQISIVIHRTSSSSGNAASNPQRLIHPGLCKPPYPGTTAHGEMLVGGGGGGGLPFYPSKFAAASKNSYRGNGPTALSFVSAVWMALGIILRFYSKQQREQQSSLLLMRIWSLVLVLALAAIIAVGVNWLYRTTLLRHDDVLSLEPTGTAAENREDKTHSCLEMGEMQCLVDEKILRERRRDGDGMCRRMNHLMTELTKSHCFCTGLAVKLEERQGRPKVSRMIQCLDQARQPALFACGPPSLVDELEQAIEEKHHYSWDPRRFMSRPGHRHISFYKESFCM